MATETVEIEKSKYLCLDCCGKFKEAILTNKGKDSLNLCKLCTDYIEQDGYLELPESMNSLFVEAVGFDNNGTIVGAKPPFVLKRIWDKETNSAVYEFAEKTELNGKENS